MTARYVSLALGLLVLAGCHRKPVAPPPPRVETPVRLPEATSNIVVPITARLGDLENALDRAVPRTVWSIDRLDDRCLPAQRVKLLGKKLKVTPDLRCRIVGTVRRGRIALGGNGRVLRLTFPVSAVVSAENIGGIVKRETATGTATVKADVRLDIGPDWTPTARISIDYDWTNPPGVTLLGKRITFIDKADGKLEGVIARLERDLPKQLRALDARTQAAEAWKQGFATLLLNRDNPPVWLRIVPTRIGFAGYQVRKRNLELTATAEALTQTFVGDRPADPAPTPLPDLARQVKPPSLSFQIPVLADYAQLEPVLARALAKLAAKGITIPKAGPVDAKFSDVTIYATQGNRLAVGITVDARLQSGLIDTTRGRVWMTGMPYNAVNSERVEINDLRVAANTNRDTVNLLIQLFETPEVIEAIRLSLTQDFAKDYDKVIRSARKALEERRQGDFVLRADIAKVTHGRVIPTGQGLFMPVQAYGTATIAYRPSPRRTASRSR